MSAARDIGRIREVSAVLVRHGFGEIVARIGFGGKKEDDASGSTKVPLAVRVRQVLEELGPTFVKLGQLASTRPDVLPADLILELKKLQDSAITLPFSEASGAVEQSLGASVKELFVAFDEEPIAAASIAQVHRAKYRDEGGLLHDVAVKIQRPGIASKIASDLDLLHTFAALLERAVPETRVYSPVGLVQQFDHAITAELDFTTEAENAARFTKNFEDDPQVRFPKIHRAVSSRQVITMEFLEGKRLETAVKEGFDGKTLARLAFRAMVKQIYEDGFFHADPHPGNAVVQGTADYPILGMLDLGMVGRLSPRMRDLTIDVIVAALRGDHEAIADALYQIGSPTKKIDMSAYRAEVALLSDRYLGKSLKDIELSAMIRDLVRAATKYGIEIPTDFVLMGKALMTIEGVGKEIDPSFDVYEESRPLFMDLLRKRYSPERMGTELLRRIERLGGAGYKVPQQLEEVLDDLRLGRLKLQLDDKKANFALERQSRRVLFGLVVGAEVLGAAHLLASGKERYALWFLGFALASLTIHAAGEAFRSLREK